MHWWVAAQLGLKFASHKKESEPKKEKKIKHVKEKFGTSVAENEPEIWKIFSFTDI